MVVISTLLKLSKHEERGHTTSLQGPTKPLQHEGAKGGDIRQSSRPLPNLRNRNRGDTRQTSRAITSPSQYERGIELYIYIYQSSRLPKPYKHEERGHTQTSHEGTKGEELRQTSRPLPNHRNTKRGGTREVFRAINTLIATAEANDI